MFEHILVPVDGSGTAKKAVSKASAMAKAFGSRVTVIYVIDPYPFTGVGTDFAYGQADYLSAATAEANAAIKYAKDALAKDGIPVDSSVIESHTAWRGIVEAGASLGANLIVMGSHGRNGIEKLVLGSVAQAVLSHTRLPVLVVRDSH
jgi:nucleotide-binding universal stress UspA family protein